MYSRCSQVKILILTSLYNFKHNIKHLITRPVFMRARVCVDCFYLRCLSNIAPDNNHMGSDQVKEQITKDEKPVVLQKYYVRRPLNY